MYYIYVLLSLKDQHTYTGYTTDPEERLKQHNKGQVLSTRYRKPFKMLFLEEFDTIEKAKKRELWWKSSNGRRKLKKYFNDHGLNKSNNP